ncbi:MAG: triose-phosphate isomerase [Elusimicrobia bacterium]|nr:triose-phosphate isomerase [Elusimicrobiota bacterium]
MIAGNWKMHLSLGQSVELAKSVRDATENAPGEVALCVPFTAIAVVAEAIKGSHLRLGAQDLYWGAQGAFTGEISAGQLVDAGCSHVIIGHSERRRLFGDSDDWINRKLKAALAAKLIPIVCVGETLEERKSEKTFSILEGQLAAGLKGFAPAELAPLVLAYEPVWAIGTGVTATPAQAQEVHAFLRRQAGKLFGDGFAAGQRILYGGSVTAENADNLMAQPDIDGALVGGASLKAAAFARIANFQVPARAPARRG